MSNSIIDNYRDQDDYLSWEQVVYFDGRILCSYEIYAEMNEAIQNRITVEEEYITILMSVAKKKVNQK